MDKRAAGERALRLRRFTLVGEPPPDPVAILVGAPHTSNWDMFLMLWMCWAKDIEPHFLMKQEVFRGPGGPVFRAVGGIPVDRSRPQGLVDEMVARGASGERFQLVIAPEGTRKRKTYWKSGFYRIAQSLDVPICLGWCDGPSRSVGFGPVLRPSGDVRADMDIVRAFYADKHGIHPSAKTEPRLREEESEEPGQTEGHAEA
jgi:1-acyl-sn-glycerol-3-phosphate acyltransferase